MTRFHSLALDFVSDIQYLFIHRHVCLNIYVGGKETATYGVISVTEDQHYRRDC